MPQLIRATISIVAFPSFTPVRVPILVPVPVLQMAEAPKNVEFTVTSASEELTVPFVPDVQAMDKLPLLMTVVVWVQFLKVKVLTAPPTVAALKLPEVEPLTSEVVHVSVVVPKLSLRIAEVPALIVASNSVLAFLAEPPTSSVVAEAEPATTAIRAMAVAARPSIFRYFMLSLLVVTDAKRQRLGMQEDLPGHCSITQELVSGRFCELSLGTAMEPPNPGGS